MGANPVYVPPVANVKVSTFIVPADAPVLPVKFNVLNQLPLVKVEVPVPVNDRVNALLVEPPAVLPKLNILPTVRLLEKLPVPDQVKPVAVSILNAVIPLSEVNVIIVEPNASERVLVFVELKIPVV